MAGYDLDRFKKAQAGDYALALEEVNAGTQTLSLDLVYLPAVEGARPERYE